MNGSGETLVGGETPSAVENPDGGFFAITNDVRSF